jgi:hypothetical protein
MHAVNCFQGVGRGAPRRQNGAIAEARQELQEMKPPAHVASVLLEKEHDGPVLLHCVTPALRPHQPGVELQSVARPQADVLVQSRRCS